MYEILRNYEFLMVAGGSSCTCILRNKQTSVSNEFTIINASYECEKFCCNLNIASEEAVGYKTNSGEMKNCNKESSCCEIM